MKRIRAVDVPKFRRPVKNNRARLGDSVYFYSNGLVYVKLLVLWFSCILLDLLFGFRFELLWPLWLMIRHLYDAFKVQNFVSSLHYSAFSVFFVCVTATSDLICYLFIPVQVLVFIASTYVWIQVVYQSTDRGFCTPTFILWGLFVGFEYSVRCHFDRSTTYFARTSWITTGLFSSSTTDNIFIGNSQQSMIRLEIYKPFAAHCLGFPLVTLGFRVKSYFSSWMLKRRRLNVQKKNEFYYKLLAEAQPAAYDPRIIASPKQLALESADFEIDDENASENGSIVMSQPVVCSSTNGLFTSSVSSTNINRKSRNTTLKSTASGSKSQNGYCSANPTNGAVCTTKRTGRTAVGTTLKRETTDDTDRKRQTFAVVRLPVYFFWLCQFVVRFVYEFVVSPLWRLLSNQSWFFVRSSRSPTTPDDLVSVSGDGSLLADEESDREELQMLSKTNDPSNTAKRRSKRTRGRTPGETAFSMPSQHQLHKPQATIAPSFASKPLKDPMSLNPLPYVHSSSPPSMMNSTSTQQQNGQFHHESESILNGKVKDKSKAQQDKCRCSIKVDELENKLRAERGNSRQQIMNMEREKEILEQALDNLRTEMHQIRSNETTVRAELSLVQNQERSQRAEINQIKSKLNDAEQKALQANRQLDKLKKEVAAQQQAKKEPNKTIKQDGRFGGMFDQQQQQTTKELVDMRFRFQQLEKELHITQAELENRQQAYQQLEQRVKEAEATPKEENGETKIRSYQKQITELQQINARLEKTLMSENRLKVDLFRALTESKAQLETLTTQMRQMETDRVRNGFDPSLNNAQLPSSLVASLSNGLRSESSSPADRVSPSSSSTNSVLASGNVVTKSSTSISDELDQILQSNGQYSYFGNDGFASTATPSTNAAAQALAQQLKMSASPSATNSLFNISQKTQLQPPRQKSRCTSPSTNELFNILNDKSISSSFGSYGLNSGSATTTMASNPHLNFLQR